MPGCLDPKPKPRKEEITPEAEADIHVKPQEEEKMEKEELKDSTLTDEKVMEIPSAEKVMEIPSAEKVMEIPSAEVVPQREEQKCFDIANGEAEGPEETIRPEGSMKTQEPILEEGEEEDLPEDHEEAVGKGFWPNMGTSR